MIKDTTNTPKLVVPYKLRTKYLHQAHDCVNHSGISRMQEHLSSYLSRGEGMVFSELGQGW